MRYRTVIADDHSIVLEGLRRVLENSGCDLLATAEDGAVLIANTEELHPDLVMLDITMPVMNGIEAARKIRERHPKVAMIVLSMHSETVYVREAFRAGVNGYVLKRNAVSEIGAAIEEVMAGRHFISPSITRESPAELLSSTGGVSPQSDLTKRQREVLQLVAEGKTAKEIGNLLNISVKTVEFHKASIMDSLGIRTVAELTRYALEQHIVGG